MKEQPILFNGDMVRAILDGRKTQTRRVVKIPKGWVPESPDGSSLVLGQITSAHPKKGKFGLFITRTDDGFIQRDIVLCPYGQPGDRLWVRESHYLKEDGNGVAYAADNEPLPTGAKVHGFTKLRPSIHMPRWASRITLEITDVRVERLQDISEEDAKAEGLKYHSDLYGYRLYGKYSGIGPTDGVGALDSFRSLWQSINGLESWDANPWVWVVEFRRMP